MIFFVLEAHGALHFSGGVDERAKRISRQRMVVAAGVDVLELSRLVKTPLGVQALEKKAFDLVRSIERVAVLLKLLRGKQLEHAADVGGIRLAFARDNV